MSALNVQSHQSLHLSSCVAWSLQRSLLSPRTCLAVTISLHPCGDAEHLQSPIGMMPTVNQASVSGHWCFEEEVFPPRQGSMSWSWHIRWGKSSGNPWDYNPTNGGVLQTNQGFSWRTWHLVATGERTHGMATRAARQNGSARHWALAPSDPQCLWNKVGRRAVPGLKSWAHFFEGIGKAGFLFSESSDHLRDLPTFLEIHWNPCNFTASNWIRVPRKTGGGRKEMWVWRFHACANVNSNLLVYLHVFLSHLEGVPHLVLWCILALIIFHLCTIITQCSGDHLPLSLFKFGSAKIQLWHFGRTPMWPWYSKNYMLCITSSM
jgi:hypothetical protein